MQHIHHDTALLRLLFCRPCRLCPAKGTDLISTSRCSHLAANARHKHMVCDLLWYRLVRRFSLRRFKGFPLFFMHNEQLQLGQLLSLLSRVGRFAQSGSCPHTDDQADVHQ